MLGPGSLCHKKRKLRRNAQPGNIHTSLDDANIPRHSVYHTHDSPTFRKTLRYPFFWGGSLLSRRHMAVNIEASNPGIYNRPSEEHGRGITYSRYIGGCRAIPAGRLHDGHYSAVSYGYDAMTVESRAWLFYFIFYS